MKVHRHPHAIRFQEIDAAGILFYGRVFDLFHDAYVGLLTELGFPLPMMLADEPWLLPLAHAEADYRAPLRFGDRVEVELQTRRLGKSSFTLTYRIVGEAGRVHAVGSTVHTCVDRGTFSSHRLPETLRCALAKFLHTDA